MNPLQVAAHSGKPLVGVIGETDAGGTTPAVYIVQLVAPPLASYRGGVPGAAATNPVTRGEGTLNAASADSVTYLNFLSAEQTRTQAAIEQALGRPVEVKFHYAAAYNGMAIVISPKEAVTVAGVPGVLRVERERLEHTTTDAGPALLGAPAVWNTPTTSYPNGYRGESKVVGVIDTGINFSSPSFAAIGADQYVVQNPRGRYYGVCDSTNADYDATFQCSSKLIGAWDYTHAPGMPADPRDDDGHGSHTASTAAGNFVWPGTIVAPTVVITANISGVAPHANIIAYKACAPDGCPTSALVAAVNQAVIDAVDVINCSIGGPSRDPWNDAVALSMLGATDAGVTVAVSAGNSGPNAATLGSPADAPWVIAVGASTHTRAYETGVIDLTGGGTTPPGNIYGLGIAAGTVVSAPIVYAGNYANVDGVLDAQCTKDFPPGAFTGKIVVCDQGTVARLDKGDIVKAAGAVGLILVASEVNGDTLASDPQALPIAMISYADGATLKQWLASGKGHMATLGAVTTSNLGSLADHMAGFSSRGPDPSAPDVLKPDVTAPGMNIFAAYRAPEQYFVISGTSMASPHTAGAAVLLKGLHPGWTPAEIRSALMLGAMPAVTKQFWKVPADPFDMGAGRVAVPAASSTGFILNETAYDFQQADPTIGGDPTTLNLASLANQACVGHCTWTRELKNIDNIAKTYTVTAASQVSMTLSVEPAMITLEPNGTQLVTISATMSPTVTDTWLFGSVDFTLTSGNSTAYSHFPVAVYPRAGAAPSALHAIEINTRRNQGLYVVPGLRAVNTPGLVKHLFMGSTWDDTGAAPPAPNPSADPFAPGTVGIYTTTLTVTDPSTAVLMVQILNATAVDMDLYVGFDASGTGQPDESETICVSGSPTAQEKCTIPHPQVGRYWVLVYNYRGSGASEDHFTLRYQVAAQTHEDPRMKVLGPDQVSQDNPFSVQINWDYSKMVVGEDELALLQIGTDAQHPDNIVSLPVILTREADDMSIAADSPTLVDHDYVQPGDIVTYTVEVRPEPLQQETVTYSIAISVPAGLQVRAPSLQASDAGGANMPVQGRMDGAILNVQIGMDTQPTYVMTTNDPTDPSYSESCDTPSGGFVHLADFDVPLEAGAADSARIYNVRSFLNDGYFTYDFYDQPYGDLFFTTGGLLSMTGYDPNLVHGTPMPIPAEVLPNNLVAPYWGSAHALYNAEAGTGVRLASGYGYSLVEYDGLTGGRITAAAPAATGSLDVEAFVANNSYNDPLLPTIIFAYDHITGTLPAGIVGVENSTGTAGTAYKGAVHDGLVICYHWETPVHRITYQAQVTNDAPLDVELKTRASSTINWPSTGVAEAANAVFATGVVLSTKIAAPERVFPATNIDYRVTATNAGIRPARNVLVSSPLPYGTQYVSGGTLKNGNVEWTLPVLDAGVTMTMTYAVKLAASDQTTATAAAVPGVSAAAPSIIGGEVAQPGSWPWQAAVVRSDVANAYAGQFCSGSLLTPDWVLTAAQCVTKNDGSALAPGAIDVIVGRHDLRTNDGQRLAVAEIRRNASYDQLILDNDIALLRLAQPAVLGATVQPVALMSESQAMRLLAPDQPTVVTGWGTISPTSVVYPPDLMQVEVPLVALSTCQFNYAAQGMVVTDNMICAGLPQGGKDSCLGDAGGPLVTRAAADQPWLLAGIVSFGHGCALPALPGVYTRVPTYNEWVSNEEATVQSQGVFVSDSSNQPGHHAVDKPQLTTIAKELRVLFPFVAKR